MENYAHFPPRQSSRPTCQEPSIGGGELMLAACPSVPSPPLRHTAGKPHGASRRARTPRFPTAAQTRSVAVPACRNLVPHDHSPNTSPGCSLVRSRPHLDLYGQSRRLHQSWRSVHERAMSLNTIQDSLHLHPVPLLRVDESVTTPSSQSPERGALPPICRPSTPRFHPQIPLKSRILKRIRSSGRCVALG